MSQDLLYATSSIVNAVTSLALGLFIMLLNPRSKLHQLWWWMSLAIAVWAGFLTVMFLIGMSNYPLALFAGRLANASAIFIPLLYLHFIAVFLKDENQRGVLRVCYALSIALASTAFTPLFITGVKTRLGITSYTNAGPLYWCFVALYVFEPTYAIRLMWRARRNEGGLRKARVTYVMAAGIVGFLVGATMFPLCFDIMLPPAGGHVVWLYCLFVTWAVFKYHLFDIHVVVRRSLVYSLVVTLLTVGYFGVVYGIERSFQTTFGYQSLWVSLAAFALMALAFQPLKFGIQRIVDRLIFHAPQHAVAKKLEVYEERARQGERYKAVATLAAGIAHELKNPLTSIKTFLEFFPERHGDPTFREQFLTTVGGSVERLEQIARGLLDFSKPQPIQTQPLDIKSILEDILALTHHELQKKALTIEASYTHNGSVVQGDASKLKQAFLNLILNAKEAMASGGTLTIFTGAVNGHLEVHIADTGCGIHPKDLPHLFEPFFSKKANGHGLGLTIVQSIIREHRGTIVVYSTPGRGTTFTVKLPAEAAS